MHQIIICITIILQLFSEIRGIHYGYCMRNEFDCNDKCINNAYQCDGKYDCDSGADEENCFIFTCPSNSFRCNYGACIDADKLCDGKRDCVDNSDESKRQCSNERRVCKTNEYQCISKQCIAEEDLCDGSANCDDNSDEIASICSKFQCPSYTFACSYGACISAALRCDGERNCFDNSDEVNCRNYQNRCLLPARDVMSNGRWSILGTNRQLSANNYVNINTGLLYECDEGYEIYPHPRQNFNVCNKTDWRYAHPQCIRICPIIESTKRLSVECYLDNTQIDCQYPYEGTRAIVTCKPLFEDPALQNHPHRNCINGTWDSPLPQCLPSCGRRFGNVKPLIVNGPEVKEYEIPWQIAVYDRNFNLICGGSLISPKITISAAHCYKSNNTDDYFVTAGNKYRQFNHTDDRDFQYTKLSALLIHNDFNGGKPFLAFDIAILIHASPFNVTAHVRPICIPLNFDNEWLKNQPGIVSGWGFTQFESSLSNKLRLLEVNYVERRNCTLKVENLQYYLPYARDKLCAGLYNQSKSACVGDSGGGLAFLDDSNRYNLIGIVSVTARNGNGCDVDEYTLYTNVLYHIAYILEVMSNYEM